MAALELYFAELDIVMNKLLVTRLEPLIFLFLFVFTSCIEEKESQLTSQPTNLTISGTIVDPQNNALLDARVYVRDNLVETRTDSSGLFSFVLDRDTLLKIEGKAGGDRSSFYVFH